MMTNEESGEIHTADRATLLTFNGDHGRTLHASLDLVRREVAAAFAREGLVPPHVSIGARPGFARVLLGGHTDVVRTGTLADLLADATEIATYAAAAKRRRETKAAASECAECKRFGGPPVYGSGCGVCGAGGEAPKSEPVDCRTRCAMADAAC